MSPTPWFQNRLARLDERLPWRYIVFDPINRIRKYVDRAELMRLLLFGSILLMIGSISYAVAAPSQTDNATEFALLMETNSGEYVAEGYPERFVNGESQSVVFQLTNNEQTATEYTIVVLAQRLEQSTVGSEQTVSEQAVLDRISVTVGQEETRYRSYELTPTISGEKVRINFLLFDGSTPDEPAPENAERKLQLMTTVSEPNESADDERQAS